MIGTAFFGYVLPWGQMSFWGATVITNLFSAVPLVGDAIHTLLIGGFAVDNPDRSTASTRCNYLLPVHDRRRCGAAHLGAAHPRQRQPDRRRREEQPGHGARSTRTTRSRISSASASSCCCSPGSCSTCRTIPATRTTTFRRIRCRRRRTSCRSGTCCRSTRSCAPSRTSCSGVVAMFSAIAVLAFLPWLDTSRVRSATFRPIYRQFFWIFVIRGASASAISARSRRRAATSSPPAILTVLLLRVLPARAADRRPALSDRRRCRPASPRRCWAKNASAAAKV